MRPDCVEFCIVYSSTHFRISGSSVSVQMLTALTVQLVQSVVKLPKETYDNSHQDNTETSPEMVSMLKQP